MDQRIIPLSASIRDALLALNSLSGGAMVLLVTDHQDRMEGTVTDGDLRRALIAGATLDSPVAGAMRRDFNYLREGEPQVERLADMRRRGLRIIPVLDSDRRIVRVIDTAVTPTCLPVSAVLMAGGRGERLRPLTLDTPKPLLPVGEKPIIDYNIALLSQAGITDITVTTHYLAEQIEAHFASEVEGVRVKCVRETTPRGTAAAITLADIPAEGDTLVMNSDLLTSISLEEMWLRHYRSGAAITIAAVPHTVSVPFAILDTDAEGIVSGLVEKPSYTHYANAGIYLIANRLLHAIPSEGRYDATDLIDDALKAGEKVASYPINGVWLDIGSPNDYRQAAELMKVHSQLSR